MSRFIYIVNLDSTITRQEILLNVSKKFGLYEKLRELMGSTLQGELPFKQSFIRRVELFKKIPVGQMREAVGELLLNEYLIEFIQKNKERCYIVTSIPDVWIEDLVIKIGMNENVFCSSALVKEGCIESVLNVIDKPAVISQLAQPFVAVGNENDDVEMLAAAEVGIVYGGVRGIAPAALACASHAIYDEKKLVQFLKLLL